jgi:hypothetical protein
VRFKYRGQIRILSSTFWITSAQYTNSFSLSVPSLYLCPPLSLSYVQRSLSLCATISLFSLDLLCTLYSHKTKLKVYSLSLSLSLSLYLIEHCEKVYFKSTLDAVEHGTLTSEVLELIYLTLDSLQLRWHKLIAFVSVLSWVVLISRANDRCCSSRP